MHKLICEHKGSSFSVDPQKAFAVAKKMPKVNVWKASEEGEKVREERRGR